MHFCPQCGSKLLPSARFCVECGVPLDPSSAAETLALRVAPRPSELRPAAPPFSLLPFVSIFGALIVFGAAIAFVIFRQLPVRDQLIASASAAAPPVATADMGQPQDHPRVQLPKAALTFIAATQKKAEENPKDLKAWNLLGAVALRAAAFDPSYYTTATDSFSHVLKLDPDNLDALRGIGNIDFDQRKYDAAIAAYEHYLSKRPDDPDVRTDLGTMLLSSGAGDEAIKQYQSVLKRHPDFFEAAFNLGIAYAQNGRPDEARKALQGALKLAPDDQTRSRVNEMIATVSGASQPVVSNASAGNGSASAPAAASTPTNFREAVEQAIRSLPIAGPKVNSVQWTSNDNARVMMDNFPMDQMPPFAAAKLLADIKSGIQTAKTTYKVSNPVKIDLCDATSGHVMKSVTE